MGKIGGIIFKGILLMVSLPLVKSIYDFFTTPTTGYLVTLGVPEDQIAIVGAVPWVFPLGILVWLIIDLAKPSEPKEPTFRMPRQQKPPKFPGIKF